jgi:integrase
MASLHLMHGKYWYLKSGGKMVSTGCTKAFSKRQVEQKIKGLPDTEELKALFFDIEPKYKSRKVTVEYAIEEYSKTINGLGPKGEILDPRRHANFKKVLNCTFNKILDEFKGCYLDEISDADILTWINQLRARGLAAGTVQKYVYLFSSVFRFGLSKYRGWAKDNPVTDKDGVVQNEFRKKPEVWAFEGREVDATEKEISKFLQACLELKHRNGQDGWFHFLMLLNVNVGARRLELLTLQRKHIDLENKRFVIETRNAKTRFMRKPFYGWNPELTEAIAQVCKGKNPEEYLISPSGFEPYSSTAVQKAFRAAAKLSGLERLTFRDFRHIAGQRMEKKGVSLNTIASQLGTSVKLLQKTYLKKSDAAVESEMLERLA